MKTRVWQALATGTVALVVMIGAGSLPVKDDPATSIEQNKATARRWSEELWGRGNLAVADEIVAAEYVRHDPGDPFPARGPEDVKRIVSMLRAMLPDFRIQVEAMVAEATSSSRDTPRRRPIPSATWACRRPAA